MRIRKALLLGFSATLVFGISNAIPALAQPDVTDTSTLSEDDGFPGVCTAPCYEVEKSVEVFFAGNPTGPGVCPALENTYVYRLTNLTNPPSAATLAFPGIPITEFEAAVDFSLVGSAGFIPGAGIAPTLTTVSPLDLVSWTFPSTAACPACLDQGKSSEDLFICSTAFPGSSPDNVSTMALILDAPGTCLVPTLEPCELKVEKFCEVLEDPETLHDPGDGAAREDVTGDPTNLCNIPEFGPNAGADVKYTYRIMNIGAVDATNVTVEDDVLGTIAGSPIASIQPGATVELMQTQFVMEDTTNTVTVDGNAGSCQATADATVTVGGECPCFDLAALSQPPAIGTCVALDAWARFFTSYLAWPFFKAGAWQHTCWLLLPSAPNVISRLTPAEFGACRETIIQAATNAGVDCLRY